MSSDDHSHRTLHRLKMPSYGVSFARARSLLDLLKATYDVLEVHRYVALTRGILHQGLNINNVFMYPEHARGENETGKSIKVENPPVFIDEVLDYENERVEHIVRPDKCLGSFVDFDDAFQLSAKLSEEPKMTAAVSRYLSRSEAQNHLWTHDFAQFYVQMPKFRSRLREIYCLAYGEDIYDKYNDENDTIHGTRLPARPRDPISSSGTPPGHQDDDFSMTKEEMLELLKNWPRDKFPCKETQPDVDAIAPPKPFCHRMDHDAESMFWVLLGALILAQPLGVPFEEDSNADTFALEEFTRVDIISRRRGYADSRENFMNYSEISFRNALHPKLVHMGMLLRVLMLQIRPEYGYLEPAPCQDHLHEAMRRHLLQFILVIQDNPKLDVQLDPDCKRPLRTYPSRRNW
ncbi:hypothetical protein K474DRAFT_1705613 [Panus rudis PR-1116 ss-1]|nr:hypothetical protein K474DRAFT_1705613 [Panus rudis PR-1116 ss-1]